MELLAPANKDTFFECINNGADAVYFGLSDFSARASANNFTLEELDYYVAYAHFFGAKMYCAVNTLIKNNEINHFISIILNAYNKGVDAFILQDVFLGKYIKELYPEIELHLSTQAGINNVNGAKLAKEFGFSRVILARETSLEEIKEICSIIETEVFVHGALCSSFSGHCYYSSYVGGNSGNRGRCKQPCRQEFTYLDNNKISFGKYNLSLSDLMFCDNLIKLKDIGVYSLKIEGRMRSTEYCACAVSLYRKALDGQNYDEEKNNLYKIYNRGDYTLGYFLKGDNIISDKIQSHKGAFYTKIVKIDKNVLIGEKKANNGDCFKIIRNGYEVGNAIFSSNKYVFKGEPKIGDFLYITKDFNLINEIIGKKIQKDIKLIVSVFGDKLKVEYNGDTYLSDDILQDAINKPTSKEEIINNFRKVDNLPINVSVELFYHENKFIAKSLLNGFRRLVLNNIFYKYQNKKNIKKLDNISNYSNIYDNYKQTIIIVEDLNNLPYADKYVLFPSNYKNIQEYVNKVKLLNKKIYLYIPAFINNKDFNLIKPFINDFYGLYVDGLEGVYLSKCLDKPVICGAGLNIFNSVSYSVLKSYLKECDIVVSKEISKKDYFGGVVLTKGKISLMEFIYCPFRKECVNCSKKTYFRCKDNFEEFLLKRTELSSCRFNLLTKKVLDKKGYNNCLINLIGLNMQEQQDLLNDNFSKEKTFDYKDVL